MQIGSWRGQKICHLQCAFLRRQLLLSSYFCRSLFLLINLMKMVAVKMVRAFLKVHPIHHSHTEAEKWFHKKLSSLPVWWICPFLLAAFVWNFLVFVQHFLCVCEDWALHLVYESSYGYIWWICPLLVVTKHVLWSAWCTRSWYCPASLPRWRSSPMSFWWLWTWTRWWLLIILCWWAWWLWPFSQRSGHIHKRFGGRGGIILRRFERDGMECNH